MRYCSHCGAQMEDFKVYCSKCGSKMHTAPASGQGNTDENGKNETENIGQPIRTDTAVEGRRPDVPVKSPAKLSKKQWIIAGIVFGIIALGIVGYNVGASLTSREKVVARFEKAIEEKDAKEMFKYIKSSDPRLKIDETSIKSLINYINKDSNNVKKITDSINLQSADMDNQGKANIKSVMANSSSSSANAIFTLKKDGKTLLLFDRYVFEVKPYFINVSTNYHDTKIFVDDKEVCTSDKDGFTKQIGPYMPGLHTLKASYTSTYANINKTGEVELTAETASQDGNQYIADANLSLDAYNVSISCSSNDAELYVNGKDTGYKVKDMPNFGPLPTDGSAKLTAVKEFSFGTVKSPEVTINGQYSVDLEMTDIGDDIKNAIMDTINTLDKSWVDAATARDVSKLVGAGDNYKNEISLQINNLKSNNRYFKGTLTKTVYDPDSVKVYQDGAIYKAVIDCDEYYNSAYYSGGSQPQLSDSSNPWEYTLIYDEASKKWLVDSDSHLYYFNPENPKEFTF